MFEKRITIESYREFVNVLNGMVELLYDGRNALQDKYDDVNGSDIGEYGDITAAAVLLAAAISCLETIIEVNDPEDNNAKPIEYEGVLGDFIDDPEEK